MVLSSAQFKHQSVRDLVWAVSSPPLISQLSFPCIWPEGEWYQQITEESLAWINVLDSDPAELDELLAAQKDRRLGKHFETLWFYWLNQHPRYEVIENNVQIIIDGETLGEIDFIVFDKTTKRTIHWEMAVKFYLGLGDTREMSNWHGPNLRDRLDIKVQHLLQRQSVISRNLRVTQWLKQQGIHIDQCAVILKGRLYYPWHCLANLAQKGGSMSAFSPAECASDHLFSGWLKQSQFDEAFDAEQCFMPLINKGWLEKIPTIPGNETYCKNRLFETVSNKRLRLPLHVQLCKPRFNCDRVFLVGENWPPQNT